MGNDSNKTVLKSNIGQDGYVERNLEKLMKFRSWIITYPDLFLDLIKPPVGGMNLHFDQRIFMRADMRFFSYYGCFTRGYGKTTFEVANMIIAAIAYPNMEMALSAQTKENAAELLKDKWNELSKFYPQLENELKRPPRFTKGDAELLFKNNSRIDIIANQQSSKGQRRKRLRIEEAALINNELFDDVLAPIVEIGRYTCGKLAIIDPCELNQQINRYTTPGWRGTDEFEITCSMVKDMADLKGVMVLGSNWMLPCWYGRGSTKSQILEKKKTMNPTFFDQNYGGKWTGSSTGALVSISNLMKCRTLSTPLYENTDDEIIMGVDVARSQNNANNKSSIAILRVRRNDHGKISYLELVNIFNISNTLNYTNQALIVKRTQKQYNAKMVVVDGNGVGVGLVDKLLEKTLDPMTMEEYNCWNTINTTNEPEDYQNAEDLIFDMKAQSFQTKVITDFIDVIDKGVLRLLEPRQYDALIADRESDYQEKFMPYIQTDLFMEEVSNLKLDTNGKTLSVKKEVSKIDKDRFSAVSYAIFYALEYENNAVVDNSSEWDELFTFRAPKIRG